MDNKNKYNVCIISFLGVMSIYILICVISGVYPLGNRSNLVWDLDIQYVEFFSYLKRIIAGEANINYSMSKSLGGSLIALFGYYLSSPLNILVVFFEQDELQLFVFILTLLKVSMSGCFFSIYLRARFVNMTDLKCILFSVSYAFSQYMLCQMTNIMWLDGVYMFPIILLGTWKFVNGEKKFLLYVSVACSVIFNWYTGYMNCLFIPFYYLVEEFLLEKKENKFKISACLKKGISFCWTELLGVLLSCFFFLPVVYCLLQGKGMAEEGIFSWGTNGNFIEIFLGFSMGNLANSRKISLYCGILVLIFIFCFFAEKKAKLYEKVILGIFILFALLNCYIIPVEKVWNGFRRVDSYFYRYSYLMIFVIIFTAAYYINYYDFNIKLFIKNTLILCVIFLFLDIIYGRDSIYLWLTIFFLSTYLVVYLLSYRFNYKKFFDVIILVIFVCEIALNGHNIFINLYINNADDYKGYVVRENELVSDVKEYDSDIYRMESIGKRGSNANLNESLSYGYWGISHYSSAFDLNMATFYQNMGYSTGVIMSYYDEPILPADSLMGVKYVLSERDYEGLKEITKISKQNNKKVYLNKYALPLMFETGNMTSELLDGDNPFERLNNIYSDIIGQPVQLFYEVSGKEIKDCRKVVYQLKSTEEDGILYGMATSKTADLMLFVDDVETSIYNSWIGRSVFYIGNGKHNHKVEFSNENNDIQDVSTHFWQLDIEEFERVINIIKARSSQRLNISDGYINGNYNIKEDTKVLLTIPYADGWRARINGQSAEIKKAFDTFMVLDLPKGKNHIILEYHVPWVRGGIIVSFMSIVLFVILNILEKKNNGKREKNIIDSSML